ncbi:CaiB/BaiF CoA-transferase family protein [Acuticoccus sp. I52.16.1]|uniref:CaiB/BaiF CoA transferase family protein n=1 Tax=Acuticoccus sp. I52.16.1 TaxID=2928472 RepID=UPI001FD03C31|nr:CoA transferase [Acuticoccus sp. I52.16.1]UOM33312.1 CoA transferase [Acuticoccus sp. I52.16.1]
MLATVLAGLKVLDLTQNVAGPYATQILGDLGAEVIKVERVGPGDDTRAWSPVDPEGRSATFMALNRNKKSICVDTTRPEGQEILRRLAGEADILVHSLKPGSAEKVGLGADALRAADPRLIYCAISAFGQVGPMRGLPGYDPLIQAFGGIMSVTGHDGDEPVRAGVSIVDLGTGVWAALGCLAAVLNRERTGEGATVEASLLDTGLGWMSIVIASYLASGRVPKRLGSGVGMTAPYEVFACGDGYVFIAAGNDRLFASVCRGLGCEALTADPRFADNAARVANRAELKAAIEAHTASLAGAEIVARLRAEGAPCSLLNDVAQVVADEQVAAVGMLEELPLAGGGDHRAVALPVRGDGARPAAREAPPALGADTAAVLAALGYDTEALDTLRTARVIG